MFYSRIEKQKRYLKNSESDALVEAVHYIRALDMLVKFIM
ncbi:MAG: hypothetical protein PWQ37_1397 [Candidatus Petromonas sp.]|jgi:hypothetical protein|nr:hypothetical protein [Candidatus Petromonas sp.]